MKMPDFATRRQMLAAEHDSLITRRNEPILPGNGIFVRYRYPILTASHTPLYWRYDFDPVTNPLLLERLGINAVFNAGAILQNGRYCLLCRVEGADRKSFFALAESGNGIDNFAFREFPIDLPQLGEPEVNAYDMRLTRHEDGWIYGLFCVERKDPAAPPGDTTMAEAKAGIVRTRDLETWERLPDLETRSPQQRNVVLHPEFHRGKYLLYTRPQDGFIETGSGGGICWGLCDTMERAVVGTETLLDPKRYHTIKELKNGGGTVPIRTPAGWLHIAHGVRGTAAGLRYVLYAFLTDLAEPGRLIAAPGGYLLAPEGDERVGDVSNVVFTNGAIVDTDGRLLVYYASSDTRLHVAETTVERMVDFCLHTLPDEGRSQLSVKRRMDLIARNLRILK